MICLLRHILAIVHFNSNLQREVKKKEDGVERVKVSYPKFKNGEATVHNARIVQNFGKQHFYILVLLLHMQVFWPYDFSLLSQPFTKNMCILYSVSQNEIQVKII